MRMRKKKNLDTRLAVQNRTKLPEREGRMDENA